MHGRMFDEAHGADVLIHTDDSGLIYAHSNVIRNDENKIEKTLAANQSQSSAFLTTLFAFSFASYSSCYEKQDMEDFAMHLFCYHTSTCGSASKTTLLCDAPRLGLLCHRMILKSFEEVSTSQGWIAMKQSHPSLHQRALTLCLLRT
ncbi:BTB/POZ and TAZ domain-containing protein 5 [Raphanus sativus]|nr:BTB/POZ and TAZ domain-containing protein 5 [Raphanus sativus]